MITRRLTVSGITLSLSQAASAGTPRWLDLPPTPKLPKPDHGGYCSVNGIKLWYAVFGEGEPVIFLHGGLANANYWGLQIPPVAQHYRVIVMDSRGHGCSTRDGRPYGYDLMADDVVGLLDSLKIQQTAVVGWSDGAILGLDLAIRYPGRVSKLFAFAANTDPSGAVHGVQSNPTFAAFINRAGAEYARMSATPTKYNDFVTAISRMWASQPNWTADQLRTIKLPVAVVDGDHDEAIIRSHTERIAATIPDASLLILPGTSHFAFMQDPDQFTWQILHFLDGSDGSRPARSAGPLGSLMLATSATLGNAALRQRDPQPWTAHYRILRPVAPAGR